VTAAQAPHQAGPDQAAGESLVAGVDVLLLDLDGTVYRGGAAILGSAEALRACSERGIRSVYITNNASRYPAVIAEQLRAIGIPADARDVVTSAQAGARLLATRVPAGTATLVVGSRHLADEIAAAGLTPVATDVGIDELRAVGAVIQGFDPELGWRELAAAAYALAGGATWVATNTDMTVPTADGIAPGSGSLVAAVAAAAGRRPEVAGKPAAALVERAIEVTGARSPLLVGDRLDTDIEAGARAGIPTLLVLTGVSGPADLVAAPPTSRPDQLATDLTGLLAPPMTVDRVDAANWRCGGWSVCVDSDANSNGVSVDGGGDRVAGLWALAHAAWTVADAGHAASGLPAALDRLGWAGTSS